MSDYVTLMGADDVRAAGNRMVEAASSMCSAAGNMGDALERHRRFLDDWLQRFESAIEELKAERS